MKLPSLKKGERALLAKPEILTAKTLRLMEMGLTEGTLVEMVRKGWFGCPLEIRVRGTRICLSLEDALLFELQSI